MKNNLSLSVLRLGCSLASSIYAGCTGYRETVKRPKDEVKMIFNFAANDKVKKSTVYRVSLKGKNLSIRKVF